MSEKDYKVPHNELHIYCPVMPNGATVGEAFQLLFGKECCACLAARAA